MFIKKAGLYIVFHTLNKTIVELSKEQFHLFYRAIKNNKDFCRIFGSGSFVTNKLFNYLKKQGFIVNDRSREEDKLARILQKNTLDRPKISTLYIIPTLECNFRCRYCFVKHNERHAQTASMTKKVLNSGLDLFSRSCMKTGEKNVVFYGGEPLLCYPFIKYAIDRIREMEREGMFGGGKVTLALNTNGVLLTNDKIDFLKSRRCQIYISIDGKKTQNDATRITKNGHGTFDLTAKSIDRLSKKGLPVTLNLTVGAHNIKHLYEAVIYLRDRFPGASFGFNFMFDFYNKRNSFIVPTAVLIKKLRSFYESIRNDEIYEDKYFRRRTSALIPYNCFNYCNAYGRQFVLLPNGEIGPCHGFAGTSKYFKKLTNKISIDTDPLWKKWTHRHVFDNEICSKCKLVLFCGGGCAYNSHTAGGDIKAPDEMNCKLTDMFVKEIVIEQVKNAHLRGI